MENSKTVCPVCTLYLREGVTLQAHLDTHPKDQVIEALLKVSNGGSSTPVSEAPTASGSSYGSVQSVSNSNASFLSQASPYINPQTQMTTAVTYQHFMTSNGSAIMPQYIQVPTIINPSTNIPVISNQALDFVPNQTMNYAHTMYNPLYNPYIPHPYPFTQPIYTSFPMSNLPVVDSNTQINQTSSSTSAAITTTTTTTTGTSQVSAVTKPSVLVKKCTVATSTEMDKTNCKNSGSKKPLTLKEATNKKLKVYKPKSSDLSGRVLLKPFFKNATASVTKVRCYQNTKKSVIRLVRPKAVSSTSSSTNSRIISPPPLTPRTETPKRSLSGSKTPPPPPLAKAPCFVSEMVNFVKSEDVPDCGETSPVIINECTNNLNGGRVEFLEQDKKPNTVIVDSTTLAQGSTNEDCKEDVENNEFEVQSVRTLSENAVEDKEMEREPVKDPLATDVEEIDVNNEGRIFEGRNVNEEGDPERQEKVFHMLEVEEESKIDIADVTINQDIPKEISSENIERNCDGSDIFIQQENIRYNEETVKEKSKEGPSHSEFVELVNKNSESESQVGKELDFYNKEMNSSSSGSEILREENFPKPPELQQMTYTDLQPAKTSRVFQDLGLTTSLNFNNYMEVDGIKIIFNNGTSTVPFDPLMKLTTGIQTDGRNITAFMKTENQVTNHALVDSVIQLVSGNAESKNEITFGDNYTPTTSKVNDIHLDLPDLSPLPLNIQADESMPARGELSEQESLGAENSTWNLFHGSNTSTVKPLDEWKAENSQTVSVIGSKKGTKSFKCSLCSEVFSCPKERRVHKNTIHLNKSSKVEKSGSSLKKPKNYTCTFCSEVFTCLRDRKIHLTQIHHSEVKNKKNNPIKEESSESVCINLVESGPTVKNETEEQQKVKTETSPPSSEADSHRIKCCARCSLPFMGVKKLREHLRLVHGEVRFKCETCSTCFDEENEYNEHLLVHPLVCDKCGKIFHKKPNLNLHMKRHLDVKPYECSLCPKSFITRQKLEEHMNGHSGKKPLKCTLCDKTFSRHSNLIQHRNLHHLNVKKKIKDFVCRCGEIFHSLRKLEWHKEVHEPKPKPCPFCSQKFIHSASVTRHIRRAHLPDYLPGDNREYDNVQCPVCEKIYLRSSLVVHMRVHNGEKPFACKICNKRFSTKWNLELHSWTHQSRSNMPFKCQICKSAFFRESDFVAHLNSHRNYKPFTCNICGQKFVRKYSCLRHQEEHKKSKQFVCAFNGCGKSFHRGYYLRDHMKVHTGIRPHTCHICGKASSTKSNHNKHIRIHDTREPVNTEN